MMAMRMRPFVHASVVAVSLDRKSTRLNSSHVEISYAVFCLKKKDISLLMAVGSRGTQQVERSHLCAEPRQASPNLRRPQEQLLHSEKLSAVFFFFNDTAPPEIYPLSLHDAFPIYGREGIDVLDSPPGPLRHDLAPRPGG